MYSLFSHARPVRISRRQLALQTLEGRDVPAGTVTATLSATGVLTIVGDDNDNGFTLRVNAGNVVLDADASTFINAGAAGDPITLTGTVTSIKADLKGGGDTVALDPTAILNVPGAVSFTLGDGDNRLDLSSTLNITMGSLTVKGGDGEDVVIVQGGVGEGSKINGAASFTYANGGSETTLGDVDIGIGMKVTAGDGTGNPNNVTLATVTIAKSLQADLGNSNPGIVTIFDSSLGGLTLKGQSVGAVMSSSAVLGSVSLKGGFQADLQLDTVTISKNVAISAPAASFDASGDGSTITGNLALTATSSTLAMFQSTTLTEVKGNITIKGGWFDDTFETNGFFRANKNVSLTLAGGDNRVTIGDGSAQASITGNLSIKTGAGNDTIALNRLTLSGTAKIATLAGKDELSIEMGSTFVMAFTADMGTGDDVIAIAQNIGSASPVQFNGSVKILAGLGNDSLFLGLNPGDSGTQA